MIPAIAIFMLCQSLQAFGSPGDSLRQAIFDEGLSGDEALKCQDSLKDQLKSFIKQWISNPTDSTGWTIPPNSNLFGAYLIDLDAIPESWTLILQRIPATQDIVHYVDSTFLTLSGHREKDIEEKASVIVEYFLASLLDSYLQGKTVIKAEVAYEFVYTNTKTVMKGISGMKQKQYAVVAIGLEVTSTKN